MNEVSFTDHIEMFPSETMPQARVDANSTSLTPVVFLHHNKFFFVKTQILSVEQTSRQTLSINNFLRDKMDSSLGESWHIHENDEDSKKLPTSSKSPETQNYNQEAVLMETILVTPYGSSQLLQIGFSDLITCTSTKPFEGLKQVIFLLPGNPGMIHFYSTFMKKLYQEVKIPILGLAHAGFFKGGTKGVTGPMTVRKQVLQKLEFIETYIPKDVGIILMGHSIGGFMAMEIMKGIEDRNQIVHSVLLMPAIQDLRLSLGAKFFAVFDFFRIFIYIWVCILWMLPEKGITRMLVWMISLFYDDVDEDAVASINELFNLKVASNSLALGRDEFEQVAERDDLLIRQNLSKLSFIFCPKDEWVPYSFVEDLINQYPEADVTTIQGVIHGFNIDRKMTDDVVQVVVSKLQPFTFSPVNKVNEENNN